MKKTVLLYILLAFLILMNAFLLFSRFHKSEKRGSKGSKKDFIVKKLNFNEDQKETYANFFDAHKIVMQDLDSELRELKDSFFNKIATSNFPAKKLDSLATLISLKEKDKDLELFSHFKHVYDICDESQKKDFQEIIKKSLHRSKRKRKHKKNK